MSERVFIKDLTSVQAHLDALKNIGPAPLTAKDTNPKDAVGSRKARWFSYLPIRVLYGVGLAMLEGARKYGRHNYRIAGVRASVYVDSAICGHLTPWFEGQDIDPDSGLHHIDKAIASLMVLRDGILEGNWVDDRPPATAEWDNFMKKQHANAGEIIDRIPNALPAYTQESVHGK